MASVLINRSRHIAIAIRRERAGVAIVEHCSGRLSLQHLSDKEFIEGWQEYDYPLGQALDRFLLHAKEVGATKGALGAIEKLRGDPMALAPRLL
jgi:hypothetical protein